MLTEALANILHKRSSLPTANTSGLVGDLFQFSSSNTSRITQHKALCLSAIYNGVNIISNDIAMLPKAVYSKDGDQKTKLGDHPLTYSISKQANQNLTSFWYHKIMTTTALLRGNAVAIINRNRQTGEIDAKNAFTFVHPDDLLDIKLIKGELWFYIKGYKLPFHNTEVIHIKGFSDNGYIGISFLKYAAKNLNAAIANEEFAQKNFDSKGLGMGIIKTEKQLNDIGKKALTQGMENRLSKGDAFNVGILDENMDFMSVSVNAQEAGMIDWKKITIEDIARWLNISPHKLKQTDKLNYNSIEQSSLDHLSDSILPWVTQFENECDVKLFSEKEKHNTYVKFNINALLRVDAKSRAQYYYQMRYAGIYSGDEIRKLEDMNPTGLDYMKDPLQPVQLQQQVQIEKSLTQ